MKILTSIAALVALASTWSFAFATPPQKSDAIAGQAQCLYAGQLYGEGSIVRVTDKTLIQCAPKSSMVFDAGSTTLAWKIVDADDGQPKSKK